MQTGIAFFFFYKVSFLKHPNGHFATKVSATINNNLISHFIYCDQTFARGADFISRTGPQGSALHTLQFLPLLFGQIISPGDQIEQIIGAPLIHDISVPKIRRLKTERYVKLELCNLSH